MLAGSYVVSISEPLPVCPCNLAVFAVMLVVHCFHCVLSLMKCSPKDLRQRMLNFFEQNFKDIDEEQHPVMSAKDLKALSVMKKTTRKVSNHYIMKLPWRDNKAVLPNN